MYTGSLIILIKKSIKSLKNNHFLEYDRNGPVLALRSCKMTQHRHEAAKLPLTTRRRLVAVAFGEQRTCAAEARVAGLFRLASMKPSQLLCWDWQSMSPAFCSSAAAVIIMITVIPVLVMTTIMTRPISFKPTRVR